MMETRHPSFDPDAALPWATRVQAAHVETWPPGRVVAGQWDGRAVFLKRPSGRAPFGIRIGAAMLRPFGARIAGWLQRPESGAVPLLREARRLVWLRQEGFAVPEVLAVGADWMLLESRGISARILMGELDAPARVSLAEGFMSDLASFHRRGLWRGGAQIKNVTVLDGCRYMIDFEDAFPPQVPLLSLQARDLFLAVLSCVDWLDDAALDRLVAAYGATADAAAVAREAAETSRFMCGRWFEWLPGRDAGRARRAAWVLSRAARRFS